VDTLTHLLVGHAMGAAASAAAGPVGVAVYWGAVIGNSLPDIDVPISLLIRHDVKMHRTFTHTLPGALLLSVIGAAVVHLLAPDASFGVAYSWTLLGCLVHMALDCLNLWGARALWPLTGHSLNVGVLHIIDPAMILLLGLPTITTALNLTSHRTLSVAFLLIWPYIGWRIWSAHRLYHRFRAGGLQRVRIIPWYTAWRYVQETDDQIEYGQVIGGHRHLLERFAKDDSPLVRATLTNPIVAAFLDSAEYPYAEVTANEVIWGDAVRRLRADFRPVHIPIDA
jgi:inner membrane protein